uniref:Lectin/glucanase superfamily protein n=1 Tax=viral metagenome TaxID=1070528 RepID=A0A6C0JS19_9ZZZZ
MDLSTILISILVSVAVLVTAYWYFSREAVLSTATVIQPSTEDGKKAYTSNKALPRSKDQHEGLTFSYTCWVKIDDFSYRYGEPKVIFTKGSPDLKTMCPALLVDGNTNSLLVKVDTFGGTETIPISNIPAKKWIHVAIAVEQDAVNVYINGNLYIHHSITQVPKQNNSTVSTGVGGGFDGKLANLEYYGYLLTPDAVKSSMANPPSGQQAVEVLPPYFDISWWTGRRG